MKIGYIDHVFDRTWKPCTKDQFYEILQSQRVADLIREVRLGKKQCKNKLPAFIFGGCLDEEAYRQHLAESEAAGEKPKGSRCEQFLRPSGLFMMDFDREEGSAFALYEKFLATMRKVGIATDGFLALAHRSPGGFGLRLVLKSRLGSSIEDDQRWVSEMMGEPIDEACKDLSRLSFAVTLGDIFYVDPKLLFEDQELPPCGDVPQKEEVEQPVQEVQEECSETTEFPDRLRRHPVRETGHRTGRAVGRCTGSREPQQLHLYHGLPFAVCVQRPAGVDCAGLAYVRGGSCQVEEYHRECLPTGAVVVPPALGRPGHSDGALSHPCRGAVGRGRERPSPSPGDAR